MKFLVNKLSGSLEGAYKFPVNFPINGHCVMDVPDAFDITLLSNSQSDLEISKVNAFKAAHPSLPNSLNDELLYNGSVDPLYSSRYTDGPGKSVSMLPNSGVVVTSTQTINTPFTNIFFHFHLFNYHFDEGPQPPSAYDGEQSPNSVLYSYNASLSSYQEPSLSDVVVEIIDTTDTLLYLTVTPDVEEAFTQATPFNFKFKFTNLSSRRLWISDWVLLYG
jgi:hypothetical protein